MCLWPSNYCKQVTQQIGWIWPSDLGGERIADIRMCGRTKCLINLVGFGPIVEEID